MSKLHRTSSNGSGDTTTLSLGHPSVQLALGTFTTVVLGVSCRKCLTKFWHLVIGSGKSINHAKLGSTESTCNKENCSNESHPKGCSSPDNEKPIYLEKHPKGFGELYKMHDIVINHTYLLPVPHLNEWLSEGSCRVPNIRLIDSNQSDNVERKATYNKIMSESDVILGDIRRSPSSPPETRAYLRAGPRSELYFNPTEVNAAIVTCGGLCPGLNNVIRELTLTLWNLYGVRKIYGIRDGFGGFFQWSNTNSRRSPIQLDPQRVANIQHQGGTILGSSRGGFDLDKIFNFLLEFNISQLYVIGGDGTHRAADKIADEAKRRGLRLSIAGIPKTIDNDVDLLDRSFGFNTSVEEAQRAILSAKTEAMCVPNGIGIVKLMGRSSGFIAAHATLSSGDVNYCCVPEVPVVLEGENGCLLHLERVLKERGHAVVVVAEGAGEELLGKSTTVDAGGNRKLPPIGMYVKGEVERYFSQNQIDVTVKYIDPSYMIRSVPANAADSLYCMLLAQNAVHGAMAGYTAFTVGLCSNRVVYLPISSITMNSPRCMDPFGRTWERVLSMTRQPNTATVLPSDRAVHSHPPI